MLEDFNVVKNYADQLPLHNNLPNTMNSLMNFKTHLAAN